MPPRREGARLLSSADGSLYVMGTWGTGIFADDTAVDIRARWRELIASGLSASDASERLIAEWSDVVNDDEEAPLFWIACAAAQAQTGGLQPLVRQRALEVIAAGDDLRRWSERPQMLTARKRALDRLALKLRSADQELKPRRARKDHSAKFAPGTVVLVNGDTRSVPFVVVYNVRGQLPDQVFPVVAPLLWKGHSAPDMAALDSLPFVYDDQSGHHKSKPRLILVKTHRKGDAFSAEIGEVITTGFARRPPGDLRKVGLTGDAYLSWTDDGWRGVQRLISSWSFAEWVAATQRRQPGGD